MANYLRRWILTLLGLLLAAVGFNYAVDPYGLYRSGREGDWKPHATTQGDLVKPYLVLKHPPRTLILGNSRAEVGFDPRDTAWPEARRPVFNLALPGTGTRVARRLFEHALAAHPPESVVLGVDFMDFLVTPDAKGGDPAMTRRLLNESASSPDPRRGLQMLHDGAATLASLDALLHSLDTLRVRGRPGVAHLTPDGFNPMHDYEQIAASEGYFNLFRQRDTENLRAYQRRPKNLYTRGTHTSPAFEDVMAILDSARARGIPVRVVIYPYHAHLLEILRITGCWELFEEWKRELAHRVASHGRDGAMLWDFSGYHRYAREVVPERGDRKTRVRWYWEAGHFKKELGHQVLERLFGAGDPEFGVMLTPDNVEAHLQAISLAGETYRQERPETVASLERLAR
jgi:hypothetical protein